MTDYIMCIDYMSEIPRYVKVQVRDNIPFLYTNDMFSTDVKIRYGEYISIEDACQILHAHNQYNLISLVTEYTSRIMTQHLASKSFRKFEGTIVAKDVY